MEGSFMRALCFLAMVLTAATDAQHIVFPVSITLGEGDACTMHSGASATCTDIRNCDYTNLDLRKNPPVRCGFNGIFPVVCCPAAKHISPQPITDIAPPTLTFRCGGNATDTASAAGVGGVEAKPNSWPWMALIGERIGKDIRWFCGGVLINEEWVLSALHCFFNNIPEVVRLGEHDYEDDNDGAPHKDFRVAETVIYPGYSNPEAYHDLALLRLASRVSINEFISPVCLPWGVESEVDITGRTATLTGYGDTAFFGRPTSYLQEVFVTVFPSAQCDQSYSNLTHYKTTWPRGIGQETLCAGDFNGGRDACQGDSGGPLVTREVEGQFVLAGIVSQGYGCGHKDYPGLYVNLRHPPYLAWIKKVAFATF